MIRMAIDNGKRHSKHLEFRIELDEIELSDGGVYDVKLQLDIACYMDGPTIYAIRQEAKFHTVVDWSIKVGPIEMTNVARYTAEAIFADFFSKAKNRKRILEACRRANGEA